MGHPLTFTLQVWWKWTLLLSELVLKLLNDWRILSLGVWFLIDSVALLLIFELTFEYNSLLGSRYLMEISYDRLKRLYKGWAVFSLSASEILFLILAVENLTVTDPCVSQTSLHLVCWCLYHIYENTSFIHLHILSARSLPFFWILWCSCWSPWGWHVL